jgi:uncharacterized MnhB-related membrane protein
MSSRQRETQQAEVVRPLARTAALSVIESVSRSNPAFFCGFLGCFVAALLAMTNDVAMTNATVANCSCLALIRTRALLLLRAVGVRSQAYF